MKTGIIYCATSRTTGKRYVGQTIRPLAKRRQSHEATARKGSKLHFHAAMIKYGFRDFAWEVLAVLPVDGLDDAETRYIQRLETFDTGYNSSRVGGHKTWLGIKRGPLSEEHRRRIGEAHTGKVADPEHMRKLREGRDRWIERGGAKLVKRRSLKGFKHSEEARRNMSAAQKGRKFSDEHRRKLSESHKGQQPSPRTEAMKRQISEKLKGHKVSDETREKISESHRRRMAMRAA